MVEIGAGRYRGQMSPNWWIVRGPNGGYIAAMLTTAIKHVAPDRPVRSLTVHYLAPPREGDVDFVVTVERTGRQFTFVSARMLQGDRVMATAMAACSQSLPGPIFCDVEMPKVAEPLMIPPLGSADEAPDAPMRRNYDMRPAIGPLPGEHDPTSTKVGGWIRLADREGARPYDERLLVALCDAWPPVMFSRCETRNPVPTIDLTVHIRQLPTAEDEWFLAVFRSNTVVDGFVEENGEIWTIDGRLIAQSRQLALVIPD